MDILFFSSNITAFYFSSKKGKKSLNNLKNHEIIIKILEKFLDKYNLSWELLDSQRKQDVSFDLLILSNP